MPNQPRVSQHLVIADYNRTTRGLSAMRYAAWLAYSLKSALVIRIPDGEDKRNMERAIMQDEIPRNAPGVNLCIEHQSSRVLDEASDSSTVIFVTPASSIQEAQRHGIAGKINLLFSFEEDGRRQALAPARLCLPFGDRAETLKAADLGMPLAKTLDVGILAIHTTSPIEGNESSDPLDHLARGAREIKTGLEARSAQMDLELTCQTTLNAPDVVDFIIRSAFDNGCGIIVMARGNVLRNGIADLTVRRSHIPVLVAA